MGLKEPLLPVTAAPLLTLEGCRRWPTKGVGSDVLAICICHVLLSMSGPILLDWVKWHHGGKYAFNIPALTFHAYAFSTALGVGWTLLHEHNGLQRLNRPDMIWRFCVAAFLFTAGDIVNFMSMQHLDAGTFSLVGKALAIIVTVLMSRVLLSRHQSSLEYSLVVAIAAGTFLFCQQELHARVANDEQAARLVQNGQWTRGLAQRTIAVLLTSSAAVFQERLLTHEPGIPFMLQQSWMGCGALATSFVALRLLYGLPAKGLVRGFCDWRVIVLLAFYVAHGLSAGLMVKRLGALARALCVPVTLGGCYAYAVLSGGAALAVGVVAAWAASAALICAFAVAKATKQKQWK